MLTPGSRFELRMRIRRQHPKIMLIRSRKPTFSNFFTLYSLSVSRPCFYDMDLDLETEEIYGLS